MGEVDVSPEAVADVIDVLHASTEYSIFSTAADLLEALSSALAQAEKERDGLRAALQITTPTARFEGRVGVAWTLLARIARHDWLDDPTEVRRALDGFVEEARDLTISPADDPTAEYVDSLTAAERERDSALSQLAEARGENAWRPIESAPKTSDDFTSGALDFLAWCPDKSARHGGDRRIVWWEPAMGRGGKGCWYCDADFEVNPTLWRPLPPLPSPPPAEGEER
jgi:hypothetical protein